MERNRKLKMFINAEDIPDYSTYILVYDALIAQGCNTYATRVSDIGAKVGSIYGAKFAQGWIQILPT